MQVEADVVGRRVGGRDGLNGAGLRCQRRDVQIGAYREAGDQHVAGEQQIVLRTLQVKRGVGQRADPLRVADANSISGSRKVSIDAVLVGQVAGNAEQAAAAHGRQRPDL